MTIRTGLAVVAASAFAIIPAMAQTSQDKGAADASAHHETLSNKLSESGGVIKPKGNVDPGMAAPAPDPTPHTTPVIPPSATGGNTAK